MKKALCLMLCTILLINTGCYNYKDVNRLFFTLSGLVDIDENENVTLYSENFRSYRGTQEKTGSEQRVVLIGTGRSVLDAYLNISSKASHEINYSQTKAVLYTENAAKYGLNNFLEPLDRDQKLTLRTFLFIYTGDPHDYIDIKMKDEQFIGIFLDDLMTAQGKVTNIPSIRLYEFLNNRTLGNLINIVPIIKKASVDSLGRFEICGAAIIKDDKLVDKIFTNEIVPYQFVTNRAKTGTVSAPHPQLKGKLVTYHILNSRTKLSVNYDGKKVYLKMNIKVKLTLSESTGPIDFTEIQVLEKMKSDVNKVIVGECFKLFYKHKEKGIDIYNVQRLFQEKYPKEKVEDVLSITEQDPASNVNVLIEGGQDMLNYR